MCGTKLNNVYVICLNTKTVLLIVYYLAYFLTYNHAIIVKLELWIRPMLENSGKVHTLLEDHFQSAIQSKTKNYFTRLV